jgi:Phage integrase family.
MGLVLKHVERTKSGSLQYRRRVPKEVSGIITKREFKRKLGATEKEALAAYPRYHAQVEREIETAKKRLAAALAASHPDASDRAAYAEALRRRADLVEAGETEEGLSLTADLIADSYPQDEYEPQGVPPVERHTINLMRLGPDRYKAPEPTLGDALGLYCKEHLREDDPSTDSRVVSMAKRVVGSAINALGRDPLLTSITREDARKVRDEMLDRVKETGRGVGEKVSPATVSRELSIIAAVVNFAKVEFGLSDAFQNPFNRLPVAGGQKGRREKRADKRDPLPPKVLAGVRVRVLAMANPELALIWRILESTGARIAEVSGLRVEDVDLSAEFPHISIEANEVRSLKTDASRRAVPLVGDALRAAQEAVERPRSGDMLFPLYGRKRGSDAASAALMKHVRAVTKDPKHVIHSLRHNMKDKLVEAEVSSLDQNLILGHAVEGVGDAVYGGAVRKLRVTTKAMKKALGVPLSDADTRLTSEAVEDE